MSLAVRGLAFVGVAAVLGGLGWLAMRPDAPSQQAARVTEGGCLSGKINDQYYSFGQWFLVANQPSNRVDWDPKGMKCNIPSGTADITVQITHKETQRDTRQIDTGKTIITQDTGFSRERVVYRFDCKNRQIAAISRSLMGDGEVAAVAEDLTNGAAPKFKPYGEGGVGVALDDEVCGAGMGMR